MTRTDELTHEHFKSDFDKLFGRAPALRKERPATVVEKIFASDALCEEYQAADEGGRILMLMEAMLERLAEPIRAERAAKLAKIEADNAALRKRLGDTATEVLGVAALVDLMAGKAAARFPATSAAWAAAAQMKQLATDLMKSVERILAHVEGGADLAKTAQSGSRGVSEDADFPFAARASFTIN